MNNDKVKDIKNKIKTPLKVSNNVFEVIQSAIRNMDSMVVFLINSPSAQPETIKLVTDATKNIKKTINIISKSITDIVKSLAELEVSNFNAVIDAGSIFMMSSIKMAINKNKGDQFKGPSLIIASYAKLLSLIAELSEYAQNINIQSIKKSSKATALVFKYLYRTQRMIGRRAEILIKLKTPEMIDVFFDSTNHVVNRITETLLAVGTLIQTYDGIGGKKARRQVRRSIKTIFEIYIDTIVGAMQLGELLFTGRLNRSFLVPKKYRTKTYGVGNILKALVSLLAMTKYFNIIFKMIPPITEQLSFIGQNRQYIENGLKTLWILLYGGHRGLKLNIHGLLEIMTHTDSLLPHIKNLAITGVLLTSFLTFSMLLQPTINTLIDIGSNKTKIVLGLIVLDLMLVDREDSKIKSLTHSFTEVGTFENVKSLGLSLLVITEMAILMSLMFIVFSSLRFAGDNFRDIRRGVRAVELILMGSNGKLFGLGKQKSLIQIFASISQEDVRSIEQSFKPIAELTALSILLNILTLNLAIIGRRKKYVRRGVKAIAYINKLLNTIADIDETIVEREITAKKIWNVSKILLIVAGMLTLVSIALSIIGLNIVGIALSIPALLMMRVVFIELVWLANYLKVKEKDLKKSSRVFGLVGFLLFRITGIYLMFLATSLTIGAIVLATGAMLAVITGMALSVLAILAISLLPLQRVSISMLTLIGISAAIFILSIAFIKISESSQRMNFISILAFIGIIAILVGLFSLIGLATPLLALATVGAILMTTIGITLLLMVVPIMLLSLLNPAVFDAAKTNAILLIDTCLDIIKEFMLAQYRIMNGGEITESDSWIKKAALSFVGGVASIFESIFSFIFVAFTFLTINMILLIALQLQLLAKINLSELDTARSNANAVIQTSLDIIGSICRGVNMDTQQTPTGERKEKAGLLKTIFSGVKGAFGGIVNIIESILSFGFVATVMVSIGMITLIAKNLEYLSKLELDEGKVTNKVSQILSVATLVINSISTSKIKSKSVRYTRRVFKTIKLIEKIAEKLNKIDDIEFNNKSIESKITLIVGCMDSCINTIKNTINDNVSNKSIKLVKKTKKIFKLLEGVAKNLSEIDEIEFNEDSIKLKIYAIINTIDSCIGTIKNSENKLTKNESKNLDTQLTSDADLIKKLKNTLITVNNITADILAIEITATEPDALVKITNKIFAPLFAFKKGVIDTNQVDFGGWRLINDFIIPRFKSLKNNLITVNNITADILAIEITATEPDALVKITNKIFAPLFAFKKGVIDTNQVDFGGWRLINDFIIPRFKTLKNNLITINNLSKDILSIEIAVSDSSVLIKTVEKIINTIKVLESNDLFISDKNDLIKLLTNQKIQLSLLSNLFNDVVISLNNIGKSINGLNFEQSTNSNGVNEHIDGVLNFIQKIADHKHDIQGFNQNIKAINTLSNTLNRLVSIDFSKNIGNYEKGVNKAIEFTNTISNAKLENLQTATNMFQKMSDFSRSINGNFEGLADTINEKIMPLLEKLNETLGKTNDNIESGKFNTSSTPTATGSTLSTGAPAVTTSGQPGQPGQQQKPQRDYSSVIGELKTELQKISKTLVDGTQIVVVDR